MACPHTVDFNIFSAVKIWRDSCSCTQKSFELTKYCFPSKVYEFWDYCWSTRRTEYRYKKRQAQIILCDQSTAANLVLTLSQQHIRVNYSSNCQETERSEVSHFLTPTSLLARAFQLHVHTAENSHSNHSRLNRLPHTGTLLNRCRLTRVKWTSNYFATLTLSSHQTVSLYPFSTFTPSLRLSPIILARQFCPLRSFSLSRSHASSFCSCSPTLSLLSMPEKICVNKNNKKNTFLQALCLNTNSISKGRLGKMLKNIQQRNIELTFRGTLISLWLRAAAANQQVRAIQTTSRL